MISVYAILCNILMLTAEFLWPQVLIVPGIFIGTEFAEASSIEGGGPLGDLVQWADLVGGLRVLGHNITLMWDVYQASRGYCHSLSDCYGNSHTHQTHLLLLGL